MAAATFFSCKNIIGNPVPYLFQLPVAKRKKPKLWQVSFFFLSFLQIFMVLEHWLTSDIFPNEVPSKFKPHHLPFSCIDDLPFHFTAHSLSKHRPKPQASTFFFLVCREFFQLSLLSPVVRPCKQECHCISIVTTFVIVFSYSNFEICNLSYKFLKFYCF